MAFLLFPRASPIVLPTSSNNLIPLLLLRVLLQIHGICSACTCHHPGTFRCDRSCTPDPGESTRVGTFVSGLLGVIGFPAPYSVDLLPLELLRHPIMWVVKFHGRGGQGKHPRQAGKVRWVEKVHVKTAWEINSLRVALIQTWISILVMWKMQVWVK